MVGIWRRYTRPYKRSTEAVEWAARIYRVNKNIITASMLWVGALMILSRGWLAKARSTVQHLSGSASGGNNPPPATGGGAW